MKRASEVPPRCRESGLRPVTSSIAATTRSVNGAGLGQERVGVRRLPHDLRANAIARRPCQARLDSAASDSWVW